MQAVILVGGEGTRMRPLSDTRPKPMLPVVDRPLVAHQLDHLRRHGVTDVIFSCGYRPEAVERHFGDGSALRMRLRYVVDPEPLGTGGAVRHAAPLLTSDEIVVRNGDILTDLDLGELVAAHREADALGTIALAPVPDPSAFGLVRLRPDRRVEAFLEKPRPEELRPGEPFLINAGTYVLRRAAIEAIPAGRAVSIERETFPALAATGRLLGFPSDAYWRDVGTPEALLAANLDVLSGAIRSDTPPADRYVGPGAEVDRAAVVGPLAVLGPGSRVAAGARIERSLVGEGSRVGRGARVVGTVLGAGVAVGEGAVLEDGVVVGDGAEIGSGVRLRGSTYVATGERVSAGG